MKRQLDENAPLWTRPFAARYLGVSVDIVAKLMHTGELRYCYPFPDNDRDARLFRDDVIAYRKAMLERADVIADAARRAHSHRRSAQGDLPDHANSLRQHVKHLHRSTR